MASLNLYNICRSDSNQPRLAVNSWERHTVYILEVDEKQCWGPHDYPKIWTRWMGIACNQSTVVEYKRSHHWHNISITYHIVN